MGAGTGNAPAAAHRDRVWQADGWLRRAAQQGARLLAMVRPRDPQSPRLQPAPALRKRRRSRLRQRTVQGEDQPQNAGDRSCPRTSTEYAIIIPVVRVIEQGSLTLSTIGHCKPA